MNGSSLSRTKELRRRTRMKRRSRNTRPPKSVSDAVKDREQMRCARCGRRRGCHVHHRRPRGAGGTRRLWINYASNLLYLCVECHLWVENNRDLSRGLGFLVPDGEDPAQWPVEHAIHGWVYLTEEGGEDGYEPVPPETHRARCSIWRSKSPACDCGTGLTGRQPTHANALEVTNA